MYVRTMSRSKYVDRTHNKIVSHVVGSHGPSKRHRSFLSIVILRKVACRNEARYNHLGRRITVEGRFRGGTKVKIWPKRAMVRKKVIRFLTHLCMRHSFEWMSITSLKTWKTIKIILSMKTTV